MSLHFICLISVSDEMKYKPIMEIAEPPNQIDGNSLEDDVEKTEEVGNDESTAETSEENTGKRNDEKTQDTGEERTLVGDEGSVKTNGNGNEEIKTDEKTEVYGNEKTLEETNGEKPKETVE